MATGQKLSDLSDPSAVIKAMAEFRQLGRLAFLERYGFRRSNEFFVMEGGSAFDSKPLAAAAYRHQHGQPLQWDDFSGGEPVKRALGALGFRVVALTSGSLNLGQVYTRLDLRSQFGITDSTINNGFFRPQNTNSIWLFVTHDKTTPELGPINAFEGDLFHWLGQKAGRTDNQVIEHEALGLEVLLFYRDSKSQFPGGGFRYEGSFRYLSHTAGPPTRFLLQRAGSEAEAEAPEPPPFDPASIEDGRTTILAEVRQRQGQAGFRKALLKAYEGRCAITHCAIEPVLEAAHIHPYRGPETNDPRNGVLLRADAHTLFDLGLIQVEEDYRIAVATRLSDTDYAAWHGRKIALPLASNMRPSPEAFAWHRAVHREIARMPKATAS